VKAESSVWFAEEGEMLIRKLDITKCDIQSGENGLAQTAVGIY